MNKTDFFNPYIVSVFMILFLLMGYLGSFNYRFSNPLNTQTILTVVFAVIVFSLGVFIFNRFNFKTDREFGFLSQRVLLIVAVLALVLQVFNMVLLGGIPLFNSVLKSNATTNIWRIAYPLFLIFINLLLAKYYKKRYLILVLFAALIFGLNGYRTSVVGILLSVFITLYYIGKISRKFAVIFILLMVAGVLAVGYIASQSIASQNWTLNPLELVFYRSAFTLEVFEKIIPLSGTTHGHILSMVFSSGSPRTFIGEYVLHYNVCLTSTIFGPVYLDFGMAGLVVQMFVIGAFLAVLHNLRKTGIYSIVLAHTLIWIETGPTDIMIWLLYLLGLVYIIATLKLASINNN